MANTLSLTIDEPLIISVWAHEEEGIGQAYDEIRVISVFR